MSMRDMNTRETYLCSCPFAHTTTNSSVINDQRYGVADGTCYMWRWSVLPLPYGPCDICTTALDLPPLPKYLYIECCQYLILFVKIEETLGRKFSKKWTQGFPITQPPHTRSTRADDGNGARISDWISDHQKTNKALHSNRIKPMPSARIFLQARCSITTLWVSSPLRPLPSLTCFPLSQS